MIKLTEIVKNLHLVRYATLKVWFSYQTPIAFQDGDSPIYVSENIWSKATGKHLNIIKEYGDYIQLPNDEFVKQFVYPGR